MADFEKDLKALEQIVEKMERGDLTLDESVRLFEEGVKLSNACKKDLETAEARIQVLVGPESSKVAREDMDVESDDEEGALH